MARRAQLDLFCEDAGHESFVRALLRRLADEAGVPRPDVRVRCARGGLGRAVSELDLWQRALGRGVPDAGDAVLVVIDANGDGWHARRSQIEATIVPGRFPHVVIGCPDPHVEAWLAADVEAFQAFTGTPCPPRPPRSGRLVYKRWLAQALEDADIPVLNDAMDVSADVVPLVDLYKAGVASPSLAGFVRDVRALLKQLGGGPSGTEDSP